VLGGRPSASMLDNLLTLGQHYGRTGDGSIFGSPSVAPFVQGSS